ncbi:hypothetical protein LSH36_396g03026 [Paralvinella palmiformis]|uniref:G-protein coupled receptors family 1 profile domain-containing protein n=1 Tax=Paralvinella palmiformis TaxID=53620 RepID=A0AAD9JE27_9ANNE|nr:hypothetical protein LSH36_396g03026 [Paralvinella palmiformis]
MITTEQSFNISTGYRGEVGTTTVMQYLTYIIGGLGLFGNGFVIVVILSERAMRKQFTNGYIINQSVVDALCGLCLILSTAFENDGRKFDTVLDEIYCRIWLTKAPIWCFFVSSTYNLIALTFERYLSIVHPVWHKTKLTKGKVVASMVLIWTFGIFLNLVYIVPTAGITADGDCTAYTIWPNLLTQRAVGVLIIFIQFLMPLCLLILFYSKMFFVLRHRVSSEGGHSPGQRKKDVLAGARKNILKTLAIVAGCFVFCWISNQVYFLLYNLGLKGFGLANSFHSFTIVLVFINCCINPLIYFVKYEQFQKAAKTLILRRTTPNLLSQ